MKDKENGSGPKEKIICFSSDEILIFFTEISTAPNRIKTENWWTGTESAG